MRRISPNTFLMPSAVTVMGTLTSEGIIAPPGLAEAVMTGRITAHGTEEVPTRWSCVSGRLG